MKVCVLGLWHLGTVTSACLAASGHEVMGLDFDEAVIADLAAGRPPIFEPGLQDIVRAGLASGRLTFSTDPSVAARAEVVWVACDTPVDDDDRADVEFVLERVRRLFPILSSGTLVLISSQVPAGSTAGLEKEFAADARGRDVGFGYSPENLRLGRAIEAFTRADRVVVGLRSPEHRARVAALVGEFTERIEWMSVESAEMTKHALNAFLATSVAFINEIASICEQVGADAAEVERGLKSEPRIGPKAYLSPGGAFAGGTLARDIEFLAELGHTRDLETHLLSSVKVSNDAHQRWAQRRLLQLLDGLSGRTLAVWGLTYKAGTDTVRRSAAIELCRWLNEQGATVRAHDPAVKQLPADLVPYVHLTESPLDACAAASALVICTPWSEYRQVTADDVVARMQRPLVLDAGRFLRETLGKRNDIEYVSVGQVAGPTPPEPGPGTAPR